MNLIINADDYGYSEGRDNAIINLHKNGILSSATLLANGPDFENAVKMAKENPWLGIGVHLCLDGPLLGSGYKTLTNKGEHYSPAEIVHKLKNFEIDGDEIFREYCFQIEKVLNSGIKVTHLDHHHHLHLYFSALRAMVRAAKKYKIKSIRTQKIIPPKRKNFINTSIRLLNHSYIKLHRNTVDAYYESGLKNGNFDAEYTRLTKLFQSNRRVVEIVLHPKSMEDNESLFYSSDRVVSIIKSQNLVNYGAL